MVNEVAVMVSTRTTVTGMGVTVIVSVRRGWGDSRGRETQGGGCEDERAWWAG